MKRRLLNLLTLLSLVLCVTAVAMWVRSYQVIDLTSVGGNYVWSERGGVHWSGWAKLPGTMNSEILYWFLMLVSLLPAFWPAIRRIGLRARQRPPAGTRVGSVPVCAVCGYDLRATPDHCPECGATPAPSP